MIVAEIQILTANGYLIGVAHGQHNIHFDCLDAAQAEYARIVDLMKRREKKANDLPHLVEVVGIDKTSFPLSDLRSVGLIDYAWSNRERSGLKEAYPNLFS